VKDDDDEEEVPVKGPLQDPKKSLLNPAEFFGVKVGLPTPDLATMRLPQGTALELLAVHTSLV